MAYLRVDPAFIDHIEVCRLSNAAFRLHFSAMLYCTRYPDLEWHIPEPVSAWLIRRDRIPRRRIAELVDGGLWIPEGDGYRIAKVHRPKQAGRARIPAHIRAAVFSRDGHACVTCGGTDDLSLDHINPYSFGGGDHIENLRTLCRSCNSRRGAARLSDEELRNGR